MPRTSSGSKKLYRIARKIMQNRSNYLKPFLPSWKEHCHRHSIITVKNSKRNGYRSQKRENALRKRNMEWVQLFDSIFSSTTEIHYHHISDAFVIPVPKKIHLANLGQNHREKLKPIIEELYQISYIIVEESYDK